MTLFFRRDVEGLVSSDGQGARLTYSPALDGIRAVSIIGIMANHGGLGWAGGGFISVDVFFVLSGFLITSLLLRERSVTGSISLKRFWSRRARRLLPALFVMLAAVALYGWLLAPVDTRSAIRSDGLATLLYVANWHQIFAGQSYFAQTAAMSPLLHTWTLAIEEQFYLVWPLVVLAMVRRARTTRPLLLLTILAAVGSAVEMAMLFHPGADPSRLYYGTDTRAQDLLTGAAMGIFLSAKPAAQDRRQRTASTAAALAAIAGFAFEWSQLTSNSSFAYHGGFLFADVFAAVVILGVVQVPEGPVARVLGCGPLAYIGRISYALYLWHWPVFVVLDHGRTGLSGVPLLAVRSVSTAVPAVLSSHFVEMPIRRGALSRWRAWVATPVAAVGTAGVLLVATVTPAGAGAITANSMPAAFPVAGRTDPLPNRDTINPAPVNPDVAATLGSLAPGSSNEILGPSVAFDLTTLYGPVRSHLAPVLFVGDSVSLTLFMGIYKQAESEGLEVIPRGVVGCGVSTAVPVEDQGVIGDPFPDCGNWPNWWANDAAYYRPRVVCLITGYWEAMNRYYDGSWRHLGDPVFDEYVESQLERAIGVLSSKGAKVALLTSPYFQNGEQPNGSLWPEADPSRIDRFNEIVRRVAARHPSVVTVVDFGKYLDPQGHFATTIDGITLRGGDGVHTTLAGDALVAPMILPKIAQLAGVSRSGATPTSTEPRN